MNPITTMYLTNPLVQDELNKFQKSILKRKPAYYKTSLSKEERKGKTPEEIKAMRIEKYNRIHGAEL